MMVAMAGFWSITYDPNTKRFTLNRGTRENMSVEQEQIAQNYTEKLNEVYKPKRWCLLLLYLSFTIAVVIAASLLAYFVNRWFLLLYILVLLASLITSVPFCVYKSRIEKISKELTREMANSHVTQVAFGSLMDTSNATYYQAVFVPNDHQMDRDGPFFNFPHGPEPIPMGPINPQMMPVPMFETPAPAPLPGGAVGAAQLPGGGNERVHGYRVPAEEDGVRLLTGRGEPVGSNQR